VADRDGRLHDPAAPGAIRSSRVGDAPDHGGRPALGGRYDGSGGQGAGRPRRLCIKRAWPGFTRTIYKDHKKYEETYFEPFPGYYFTGDGALRDSDGYYRITGRIDDVINVSATDGTAEVEAALNSHEKVAESAVVGYPTRSRAVDLCYVTLNTEWRNPMH